jgi:uncharacterized protein YegP (UPF0339 family)
MPGPSRLVPIRAVVCGPAARGGRQIKRRSTHGRQVRGLQRQSGGFRFRLKAGNGEVIASSESYKSKASALNGVESVKKNAGADVVDLTEES